MQLLKEVNSALKGIIFLIVTDLLLDTMTSILYGKFAYHHCHHIPRVFFVTIKYYPVSGPYHSIGKSISKGFLAVF